MACSLALRLPLLAGLSFIFLRSDSQIDDLSEPLFVGHLNKCKKDGQIVPCWPGSDACGAPFKDAPSFHLMSQHGCAENDPNGPVFDPVHGVIHHFYQAHLAANEGVGPIYGHFVSKDFVHWTELPVAIWNGLDTSSEPPRQTFYDAVAIYTGSALVLAGAGPSGAPGIVQIYPGLCDARWPECKTGTLLAQAVPADYSDQLLTNWTKPLFNPIMENVQRDPTTPWKEATGEWRLRTFDGEFYGSANDADLLKGKWYRLGAGDPKMWPTCECPSFFPLPGVTPGFEIAGFGRPWPSHVQKLSCEGHDWWMIGSYTLPNRSAPGNFSPTVGWEDLFKPQLIDAGAFYASKDALYPSKQGLERRINWGWAQVRPNSTQSLPRVITFNPRARLLEQAPLPELEELRGSKLVQQSAEVSASAPLLARLPFRSALRSETIVRFTLPQSNAILRVGFSPSPHFAWMESVGFSGPDVTVTKVPESSKVYGAQYLCQSSCEEDSGCLAWSFVHQSATCHHKAAVEEVTVAQQSVSGVKQSLPPLSCAVFYEAVESKRDMEAICGDIKAPLRLLAGEKSLELRIFADATFLEVFFQNGRLAMTVPYAPPISSELMISSTVETSAEVSAYAMKSIWVNEEYVRKQSRVYPRSVDLWS